MTYQRGALVWLSQPGSNVEGGWRARGVQLKLLLVMSLVAIVYPLFLLVTLRVTVVCVCFCGSVDKEVLFLPSIGYCNWRNSLGKKLNICVGWTPH